MFCAPRYVELFVKLQLPIASFSFDTEPKPFRPSHGDGDGDAATTVEPTTSSFDVGWTYPPGSKVDGWKVNFKPEGADDWEDSVNTTDGNADSATLSPTDPIPGATYDVQIVPVAGDEENADSEIQKMTLSK